VYFIIIAVGNGLATGNTALIGNAMGKDDTDEARLYAAQGVTFGVLTALVMTVLGKLAAPSLFRLLGADEAYLAICLEYINPMLTGTIFFILLHMFNAVLMAQGDTRTFRNFLIGSCLMNLVLDPWFIHGGLGLPAMGIAGIAWATVLLIACGAVYMGFRAVQTGAIGRDFLRLARPRAREFMDIAYQGFPAGLNMMTVAVGIFVITYFVSSFGKEAVAAYGIGTRAVQIVLLPTIGLNMATLTLVAQNNGAGLFDRVQEVLGKALKYGAVIMALGMVLVLALAGPLISMFTDDPKVIAIGSTYLRIEAIALYAYVILFVHVSALQGIKRPLLAIWIGLTRQIVAPVIVFWVLTKPLGMDVEALWWGIVSIVWTSAFAALFYARRVIAKARAESA
jgi:putative MATE family efflux protein